MKRKKGFGLKVSVILAVIAVVLGTALLVFTEMNACM